jgi:hypothetical protein
LAFKTLVDLQMAFGSYEVGVIQRTPLPPLTDERDRDRTDETTHAFGLPALVHQRAAPSLAAASQALDAAEQARQSRLAAIQAEIDEIVLGLYGLTIDDCGTGD